MPPASRSSRSGVRSGVRGGVRGPAGRHPDVKGRPRRCTDVRDRRSLRGLVRSLGEVDRAHEAGVHRLEISSSTSAGMAESTESATSACPPLVSRATCMPPMLTLAVAEDPADGADHAGPVLVAEEREVVGRLDVDVVAVHLDEPLPLGDADQGAGHRDLRAVGERAPQGDQVAVVRALARR